MFMTLVEKELKAILLSPKFVATFSVCSILILLSIYVGIQEYHALVKQYETATHLTEQEQREQSSWMGLHTRVFRKPDPMQIFVSGVNNDIGRLSSINSMQQVKLRNSVYSDDPIYAVFRYIDFAFIVQVVLSLFAILFTYDAINGERESGTLKLTFANAVPRVQYILSKFLGSWIALVVPLLLPLLLGLLLVQLYKVPMSSAEWSKLVMLFGVSLLFFTFFIAFGILISSLTRSASVSFLTLLVIWITFVLVIPRAGVMAAGQVTPVPSIAEIEGQRDGFSKESWTRHTKQVEKTWRERNAEMEGMNEEEREAYSDENLWNWMEEDDAARKEIQVDINEFSKKLHGDLRNRQAQQERLGFLLSRFSPASAFQLAAMNLAGTNISLKKTYEDAMQRYRDLFNKYQEKKQDESGGGHGGMRISISSDSGVKVDSARDKGQLDLSDMPRFEAPQTKIADILPGTVLDCGL
ncbi:ABC transporter permease subunit, partial [bacterium]|nr:ABC transporter permease subunit [bacterium]